MTSAAQSTASQTEFAAILGVHKSHITRLKQAKRLVMTEAGLVDVELSKQLIAETADPSRQEASERHAKHSGKGEGAEPKNTSYNDARTRKELAQARNSEVDLAVKMKELVSAEDARLFAADLGASFRVALEVLPDRLAPELVALTDVESLRAVLVENFEQLLTDVADKVKKWETA